MVVSRFNFLTFIVEVLCDVKESKKYSAVVINLVQTARGLLGLEGLSHLPSITMCSQETEGKKIIDTIHVLYCGCPEFGKKRTRVKEVCGYFQRKLLCVERCG